MTNFLIRTFVKEAEDVKNPAVRDRYGRLAGIVGIVCNVLLSGSKMLMGILFSSIALLADGINNLSDATSSIVTLVGFKLSSRPADPKHPYGHARIEYIAGVAVAFFILIVGFDLTKSSIGKIINPDEVVFSYLSIGVLFVSILVKFWMMLFNKKVGKLIDSTTLVATSTDSRNDVITSSVLLAGLLIAKFTGWQLDGFLGLGVAVFILISGIKLINETLSPILGEAPDQELVKNTLEKLRSYKGVLGIHDLMIHDYGPGRCFASVHIEMDAKNDILWSHDQTDLIERHFADEGINLVVHLDPVITDDESINELKKMTSHVLAELNLGITMHDFRVVRGYTHTNLIFDIVVPFDCPKKEDELKMLIQRGVKQRDEKLFTVINVDKNYIG